MTAIFEDLALNQLEEWVLVDRKIASKILKLIKEIKKSPFEGIGKPEPLKHNLKGLWSRRITDEHRLIYKVEEKQIIIISCKYHYE
ncbi:MAG: Txe/YoeB family addiction module toxin [Bacteroidota bacterium]|nr:Txe/YoeB family addiction module toxin [Bacteroidota bacterium]